MFSTVRAAESSRPAPAQQLLCERCWFAKTGTSLCPASSSIPSQGLGKTPLCLLSGFPGQEWGASFLQRGDALATSGLTCVSPQPSPGPAGGSGWLRRGVAHPSVSCGRSWVVPLRSQRRCRRKPEHGGGPCSAETLIPTGTGCCPGAKRGLQHELCLEGRCPWVWVCFSCRESLEQHWSLGAKRSQVQQGRVTWRELKYLVSSQLSTPEMSCPVVRYFKYNVFILYIFIHM